MKQLSKQRCLKLVDNKIIGMAQAQQSLKAAFKLAPERLLTIILKSLELVLL